MNDYYLLSKSKGELRYRRRCGESTQSVIEWLVNRPGLRSSSEGLLSPPCYPLTASTERQLSVQRVSIAVVDVIRQLMFGFSPVSTGKADIHLSSPPRMSASRSLAAGFRSHPTTLAEERKFE